MEVEDEVEQQKQSKYNSGVAQIQRLDELWKDTHRHSRNGQLTKWNWDLDRIWMELVGDLNEDDERINTFQEFKLNIGDLNKKFVEKVIQATEYHQRMYDMLMEKEEFLRRLQNKLGKGSKYLESDEDYMEG